MSAVCFLDSFRPVLIVTIVCLPEVYSVLEVRTDLRAHWGSPSQGHYTLHVWRLFRGLLRASVPDDGCQCTDLAVPKGPNNLLGDFKVLLVIYNESVSLFHQFKSSIGNFPWPLRPCIIVI